jgi:glycyl-tRNA synthetase
MMEELVEYFLTAAGKVQLMEKIEGLCRFDRYQASRGIEEAALYTLQLAHEAGLSDLRIERYPAVGELEGIANRTDFDLSTHSKHSGADLSYFDQAKGERWTPYVIEPAAGLTRSVLAFLLEAYDVDEAPNTKGGVDKRTVLRFDPRLAPVKAAVLPLSRNEDLSPKAKDLAARLRRHWNVDFDDAGAIGRRYRRADEIGTPYCITVDFDTLEDQAVTIRDRDSMKQERVALDQVERYLLERL